MPGEDGLAGCHMPFYVEGKAVGVARTPFALNVFPQSYAKGLYAEGLRYADGQRVSAEGGLRRRATLRTTPRAYVCTPRALGHRHTAGFL
jgi:hypothetical protein